MNIFLSVLTFDLGAREVQNHLIETNLLSIHNMFWLKNKVLF